MWCRKGPVGSCSCWPLCWASHATREDLASAVLLTTLCGPRAGMGEGQCLCMDQELA